MYVLVGDVDDMLVPDLLLFLWPVDVSRAIRIVSRASYRIERGSVSCRMSVWNYIPVYSNSTYRSS